SAGTSSAAAAAGLALARLAGSAGAGSPIHSDEVSGAQQRNAVAGLGQIAGGGGRAADRAPRRKDVVRAHGRSASAFHGAVARARGGPAHSVARGILAIDAAGAGVAAALAGLDDPVAAAACGWAANTIHAMAAGGPAGAPVREEGIRRARGGQA